MSAPALHIEGLVRQFSGSGGHTIRALDDVSFTLEQGDSVALLGRNGAGKTTLAKIISTVLLPTSGTVQVFGHDVVRKPRQARSQLTVVMGGDRGLYSLLSGRENVRYFAMLNGMTSRDVSRRVPEVLEEMGLSEAADRRVEEYSKGMRQRLQLAIALAARPRLLILDEPTVGLDPLEAQRLRTRIAQLREEKVTVLLTSHVLLDVERLSDRVMLIDEGRLTHDLSVRDFAATTGYASLVKITLNTPLERRDGHSALRLLEPVACESDLELTFRVKAWDSAVMAELASLTASADVADVSVTQSTLDDAFALVAGRGS